MDKVCSFHGYNKIGPSRRKTTIIPIGFRQRVSVCMLAYSNFLDERMLLPLYVADNCFVCLVGRFIYR